MPDGSATADRAKAIAVCLVAAWAVVACGTRSSAIATGAPRARFEGTVRLTALPASVAGAREVGLVEVESIESLETAGRAFQDRVAELGGNVGLVERAWMTFEMESRTRTESYGCGTSSAPRTCTRTVTSEEEVGHLHFLGRALWSGGE
jgi:hypothetical protein